jgi:uncharacterized delta-60 repeat protein
MPRATFAIVAALLLVLAGRAAAYVPADLDRGFGHRGVVVSSASSLRIATRHNLVRGGSETLAGVHRDRQGATGCAYDTRLDLFRLSDGAFQGSQAFPVEPPCFSPIPGEVAVGRDAGERMYVALGGSSSIQLTRLLGDGSPDPAFGLDGTAIVPVPRPLVPGPLVPERLRVESDESVLLAGVAAPGAGAHLTETFLARVAGGILDPTFGEGGIRFFDIGLGESTPEPSALAVGRNGDIYLSGPLVKASAGHQLDPAGIRAFLPDGGTDKSFGKGGFAKLGGSAAPAMVFSKERLIVAVNRQGKPPRVVQLTEAGKLDRRFGKDGIVTLPARGHFGIAEIAVDGNDRITLAGTLQTHIVVDRLGPGGSQDRTFAGGGVFHLDSAAKVPFGAPTVEGLSLSSGNGGGGIAVTGTIQRFCARPPTVAARSLSSGSDCSQAPRWDVRFRLLGQTSHERCGSRRATIVGTSRGERIVGTPRADVIAALGGNDTILGRGGNDLICGGSGRDTIEPGPGRDTVFP